MLADTLFQSSLVGKKLYLENLQHTKLLKVLFIKNMKIRFDALYIGGYQQIHKIGLRCLKIVGKGFCCLYTHRVKRNNLEAL